MPHRRTTIGIILLSRVVITVVLCMFSACAIPPAPQPVQPVPAAHHSADLQLLMRRMNDVAYDRNQTELELDKKRLRGARELAIAARELAARAESLTPISGNPAEDIEIFSAYAAALAGEAEVLNKLVEGHQYSALSAQMARVRQQCVLCHQRFLPE